MQSLPNSMHFTAKIARVVNSAESVSSTRRTPGDSESPTKRPFLTLPRPVSKNVGARFLRRVKIRTFLARSHYHEQPIAQLKLGSRDDIYRETVDLCNKRLDVRSARNRPGIGGVHTEVQVRFRVEPRKREWCLSSAWERLQGVRLSRSSTTSLQ